MDTSHKIPGQLRRLLFYGKRRGPGLLMFPIRTIVGSLALRPLSGSWRNKRSGRSAEAAGAAGLAGAAVAAGAAGVTGNFGPWSIHGAAWIATANNERKAQMLRITRVLRKKGQSPDKLSEYDSDVGCLTHYMVVHKPEGLKSLTISTQFLYVRVLYYVGLVAREQKAATLKLTEALTSLKLGLWWKNIYGVYSHCLSNERRGLIPFQTDFLEIWKRPGAIWTNWEFFETANPNLRTAQD